MLGLLYLQVQDKEFCRCCNYDIVPTLTLDTLTVKNAIDRLWHTNIGEITIILILAERPIELFSY